MSSGVQTAEFIYLMAILVFVASALMVRRIPIGRGLQMFAGWVIIFLAAFVAFTLKDDIIGFAQQVMDERRAESTGVQVGEELRIKQSLDGHFWVDARVNGQNVRFLIDSGATTTSISGDTARRAGIEPSSRIPAVVQTANGVVQVQRGRIDTLRVGHIERENLAVHVSDAFGDMNVLGMNFLSSLSGWRVERRNLILTP
ncbi:MAG TPA: TIGR02281 family clan AA aspartic protease [Allosphingosinicella sp.]|nr:TIGR02281 family clan AA aspartic protease [Allosphingosinicella sp.]